ncbi:MAG: GIY-YIG nuclease family protein, partial [Nitrososphaerales archaeon]
FIKLCEDKPIRLRSELRFYLEKGYYIYTGSAFGEGSASLERRVRRHLSPNKKRFWHIDHLLDRDGGVLNAIYSPTERRMECEVNKKIYLLLGAQPIKGFGSSDCRAGCLGHLLHFKSPAEKDAIDIIWKAYSTLGLEPRDLGMRVGYK